MNFHQPGAKMSSIQNEPQTVKLVGRIGTIILGIYLILAVITLCILMFVLWPGVDGTILLSRLRWFPVIDAELQRILLVIVAGALGSYIHTATSFADYVGNGRLVASWVWWYILRTFIGVALSLVFYFVLRGGLLSINDPKAVNPFGVASVAALVGMFSKQATDKLREVFDNLFKTATPVERQDPLQIGLQISKDSPEKNF